jgi:predicted RNA-binding Zn-ribbon protein involved in translation (DUF1610 family)
MNNDIPVCKACGGDLQTADRRVHYCPHCKEKIIAGEITVVSRHQRYQMRHPEQIAVKRPVKAKRYYEKHRTEILEKSKKTPRKSRNRKSPVITEQQKERNRLYQQEYYARVTKPKREEREK